MAKKNYPLALLFLALLTFSPTASLGKGLRDAPQNVFARPLSSHQMLVTWYRPETVGSQITGYRVYFTKFPHEELPRWDATDMVVNEMTTIGHLAPSATYTIRVQAYTTIGPGAISAPIQVKMDVSVPGQPGNFHATNITPTSVDLEWTQPRYIGKNILGYGLYWNTVPSDPKHLSLPVEESCRMTGLQPDTTYFIRLAASTTAGEGALTFPIIVRTKEYIPKAPYNVSAIAVSPTAIAVRWEISKEGKRDGFHRGYVIYVQKSLKNRTALPDMLVRYDVLDPNARSLNVTDVQPGKKYLIQVSALGRKGNGPMSKTVSVRTPRPVPSKPGLTGRNARGTKSGGILLDVEWTAPNETFGKLVYYRLKYGPHKGELWSTIVDPVMTRYQVELPERGVVYEFRMAAANKFGEGQEAIRFYQAPELAPSGPPVEVSSRLLAADVAVISWLPPLPEHRNGRVIRYYVSFQRRFGAWDPIQWSVTTTKAVYDHLEENTEYWFEVSAATSEGRGPLSQRYYFKTERSMLHAPRNVIATATSNSTIEVRWDGELTGARISGYRVFYSAKAFEEPDAWQRLNLPVTTHANLVKLEKNATYWIGVCAMQEGRMGRMSELVSINLVEANYPTDYPSIIANDDFYGGLGGEFVISTRSNRTGTVVLRHEMGHNFVNVGEEYDNGQAYRGVNSARSVDTLGWTHWLSSAGAKEERAIYRILEYPWADLAKGPQTIPFSSDGTYSRWYLSVSVSAAGEADSLEFVLDGKVSSIL